MIRFLTLSLAAASLSLASCATCCKSSGSCCEAGCKKACCTEKACDKCGTAGCTSCKDS